jgi:hypothetical protein
MLGGLDPLILFSFRLLEVGGAASNAISSIPIIGETIAANIAVPVPIYLSENLTGIFVQSESRSIDIDTFAQQRKNAKGTIVSQRGVDSSVTVEMTAKADSIPLVILLATCDMVFTKLVAQNYSVSYFNGATTIFNGLLTGFSTQADKDTDKLSITLQISKSNQKGPTDDATIPVSNSVRGLTP